LNYLSHLHIADQCQSSLIGNLLGDFVKGDPNKHYYLEVSQGVRLHRFVDSFTDSHQMVVQAKSLFPNGPRRFSGIALDMFWDHCLANHWQEYHSTGLDQFCAYARKEIEAYSDPLPENFMKVTSRMWQGRWLESYQDIENIEFALQRMSLRSPRMSALVECFPYVEKNYIELEALFAAFYPEILNASKRF
jgi:acyl carrier protein phosphodiesterase